ncbi:hypothetical protein F5051DRAFT_490888 [Lentinula edodes]|nr:hypothetical protein F5051DRAFT_490888 [Lentinula edodes]
MLLLPIYFILGLLSTVYSAPFAAISNQGAPHLQIRAEPAVPFVDVRFNHVSSGKKNSKSPELYTWKSPPSDVQRRVAIALFGDAAKEKVLAIRWTNTYLESDGSFQWRVYSSTNTYQSSYSDKILIPVTEEPSKTHILVDFKYLKRQRKKEEASQKNPDNAFPSMFTKALYRTYYKSRKDLKKKGRECQEMREIQMGGT